MSRRVSLVLTQAQAALLWSLVQNGFADGDFAQSKTEEAKCERLIEKIAQAREAARTVPGLRG